MTRHILTATPIAVYPGGAATAGRCSCGEVFGGPERGTTYGSPVDVAHAWAAHIQNVYAEQREAKK